MDRKRISGWVIGITILCCAAMAAVDGLWRPVYSIKSAVKIGLFLGLPLLLSLWKQEIAFRSLFRLRKKGILLPNIIWGLCTKEEKELNRTMKLQHYIIQRLRKRGKKERNSA